MSSSSDPSTAASAKSSGEGSVTLLPCPFCGEAEELYPSHHYPGGGKPYAIDCLGCGFDFVPRPGFDVIAAWNRRAPLPPTPQDQPADGASSREGEQ